MQLYDLIKSRVEGHDFREKIELAQVSLLQDLPGMNTSLQFCFLVLVEIKLYRGC